MSRRSMTLSAALFTAAVAFATGCGPERSDGAATRNLLPAEKGGTAPTLGADPRSLVPARDSAGPAASSAQGDVHALMVGVSKYQDQAIPPLEYARSDAESIASFFVDDGGLALPPGNVKLLLDREATRDAIQRSILELNEATTPTDTVWIYFAGHGTVEFGEKGELLGNFLLPHDARSVERKGVLALDPRTGLALADLQQLLQVNKARTLILVLDACFSGGARSLSRAVLDAKQAAESEAELDKMKDAATGRAVITATAPNQPALELDRLRGGLFTHYLVESLSFDANRDQKITLDEAYGHLFASVRDEARALGREQTPTLKQNLVGVPELRTLPKTRFVVGLAASYGGRKLDGQSAAPSKPFLVPDAREVSLAIDAWKTRAPLHAYVLKVAITDKGTRSERLLPDGENAYAPPVTIAEGRGVVYPNRADRGIEKLAIAGAEANADVFYALIASDEPIDGAALDELERKLKAEAAAGGAATLGRRAAAALEGSPTLKRAALRYLWVRHGRGPSAAAGGAQVGGR